MGLLPFKGTIDVSEQWEYFILRGSGTSCVFMHVQVSRDETCCCGGMYICMWRPEAMADVFFHHSLLYFLRQGLSLKQSLPDQQG